MNRILTKKNSYITIFDEYGYYAIENKKIIMIEEIIKNLRIKINKNKFKEILFLKSLIEMKENNIFNLKKYNFSTNKKIFEFYKMNIEKYEIILDETGVIISFRNKIILSFINKNDIFFYCSEDKNNILSFIDIIENEKLFKILKINYKS